jgi:hypothetical protein
MRDESVRVEVTEVDGPRRTAVVVRATVAHAGDVVRVYLPAPFALQPGQQYRVSVGPGSARACRIAAGEDGGLAVRLAMDIVAERRRSLVVGDVQDTRDIVDSVARSHGRGMGTPAAVARLAQARTLLRQGDPVGAYAAAVCAEQLTLPASFELAPPGGRLTPYRVRVACSAAPVRVTLLSAEARSLRVRVVTAAAQDVTISWRGSATTASLAPSVPAEIELVRRDAGVPRGAGVRRRSRRR